MHMRYEIDEKEGIRFLYQFEPGHSTESQGIHVARMAGVPIEVCERAAEKASLFRDKLRELQQRMKESLRIQE